MTKPLQLLFSDPPLFWNKARNRFSSAHTRLQEERDQLLIGLAYANLCKAIYKTPKLKTAYAGKDILGEEALADFGFTVEDSLKGYFEGRADDLIRPYQEISSFDPNQFDVILIGEKNRKIKQKILDGLEGCDCLIFDLERAAALFSETLRSIKSKHFLSCLNSHKLAAIALALWLCPAEPVIIEAGAFQCGTTLFMAKFLHKMGKQPRIYALDTFQGIPKAKDEDKKYGFVFDEGIFTQAQLSKISKRLKKERVHEWITLVPGLIEETLPRILEKEKEISLLFLDTDQYAGTKSTLDLILPLSQQKPLTVIVDDTTLPGVNQAIVEALAKTPAFQRHSVFMNFDILIQATRQERFLFAMTRNGGSGR